MTLKEFREAINELDTKYDNVQVAVNVNDQVDSVKSVEYVNEYHYDYVELKLV